MVISVVVVILTVLIPNRYFILHNMSDQMLSLFVSEMLLVLSIVLCQFGIQLFFGIPSLLQLFLLVAALLFFLDEFVYVLLCCLLVLFVDVDVIF